jgi:allantoinase
VHVNEPGRTEWEGFDSATRAAAAGGITTMLDMPLNAIPATTKSNALAEKRAAARGKCHVDVGFIGGVVADNARSLQALHNAGILAWKCFLIDSGVPEFAAVDERALRAALPQLAAWNLPLMVHAELPEHVRPLPSHIVRQYTQYVATRPVAAEVKAVELTVRLAREFAVHMHIVHVSSGDAAQCIADARASGAPISGETCPHYLTFAAEEIPDGATAFKCAPPIREAAHREALWDALVKGSLQMIVSDHSPSPPALKSLDTGDFAKAWGGIASLQVGLSAVWTEARKRGIALERVVDWMSTQPAALVRLGRKGRIAEGFDADLVVFDPDETWTVDGSQLLHRHPLTPYAGLTLAGRVLATYLRGDLIYDRSSASPTSPLLERDDDA